MYHSRMWRWSIWRKGPKDLVLATGRRYSFITSLTPEEPTVISRINGEIWQSIQRYRLDLWNLLLFFFLCYSRSFPYSPLATFTTHLYTNWGTFVSTLKKNQTISCIDGVPLFSLWKSKDFMYWWGTFVFTLRVKWFHVLIPCNIVNHTLASCPCLKCRSEMIFVGEPHLFTNAAQSCNTLIKALKFDCKYVKFIEVPGLSSLSDLPQSTVVNRSVQ